MNIFFPILLILIIGLLTLQSIRAYGNKRTEQQPYKVIEKNKDFEIRWYPSAMMATLQSKGTSFRTIGYPGFRKLANYIFGNNSTGSKIAMTAPVHMNMNEKNAGMSFVMPAKYSEKDLPLPNDPDIHLVKSEEEYVAAIRFGGYVSDKDVAYYSARLDQLLTEKGIRHLGNFRYLGYNPPFQLIGRRNEIIVTIIRDKN